MGVDANTAGILLAAQKRGVRFDKFAMLGRQELKIHPQILPRVLAEYQATPAPEVLAALLGACGQYAEPFFQLLGAREIASYDATPYEKATCLHDMNNPISDAHKGIYDVVFDGGSLEHIFNFPVAIKNCMEMVKVGGHFIGIGPANSFFGHGFYQFSAELYYRVFCEANGFAVEKMLVFETVPFAPIYEVPDPATVGRRVELTSEIPMSICVQARRLREATIFAATPQQSDYVSMWKTQPALPPIGRSVNRGLKWLTQGMIDLLKACHPELRRRLDFAIDRRGIRRLSRKQQPANNPLFRRNAP